MAAETMMKIGVGLLFLGFAGLACSAAFVAFKAWKGR